MRRGYLALVLALAVVLGTVPSNAGPGSTHWTQWARRPFVAGDMRGAQAWWKASRFDKLTLASAPRAAGTSPPTCTFSGTGTRSMGLRVKVASTVGGTALGQATIDYSENNGSTYTGSPVTSAASVVLGTTGITFGMSAGTYNTNQTWDALPATVTDLTGHGNTLTALAASVLITASGINGRPAFDYGTAGTANQGFSTPSMTIGVHSIAFVATGQTNASYLIVQVNDGTNGYIWGRNSHSSRVARGGNTSDKTVSATWASDGVARSIVRTFAGTHATHLLYRNGTVDTTTDTGGTADPGTSTVAGAFYLGANQTGATPWRGVWAEVIIANVAWTPAEVAQLQRIWAVEYGL